MTTGRYAVNHCVSRHVSHILIPGNLGSPDSVQANHDDQPSYIAFTGALLVLLDIGRGFSPPHPSASSLMVTMVIVEEGSLLGRR